MVGDVAAEIRANFAKEPERFFLVGDDGIEYGYSMDKLHEKLPNGGSCKVRFGDKTDKTGEKDQLVIDIRTSEGLQRFTLLHPLAGSQTCGVYKAIDIANSECVVKLEYCNVDSPQIDNEARVLIELGPFPGVPTYVCYGKDTKGQYNALVTRELGTPLDTIQCSQVDVVLLTVCILKVLQHMFAKEMVHGDIHPGNIILYNELYMLIDYGITRNVSSSSCWSQFIGTLEFSSLRVMEGHAALFRDDLESLLYVIGLVVNGSLPWLYETHPLAIYSQKRNWLATQHTLPIVLQEFFEYVLSLDPTTTPLYTKWITKLSE